VDTPGLTAARRHLRGLDYQWKALIVVITGTFMVMLDSTIVNIALPDIITFFQAPVRSAQFVLTGYMLAIATVMPAAGYMTDTFGTKRIYLLAIASFTVGSLLCGLSWNVPSLIAFRVIQGLGGGMLMPLGMTILFKAVDRSQIGKISGLFGLPLVLGPVIGPTLGGYIVQYVDWRLIFTINIPVCSCALLLGWKWLRETDTTPDLHFDWKGFLLSASGFSSLLYGFTYAPSDGWGAPHILALVGGGVVLLVLWVVVELREPQPLVEMRVFKNITYTLATSVNFIITLGMFSSLFLLPLFLQNFKGLGALETGLVMFPQALASGLMAPIAGQLFDRIGARPLIVSGLLILAYTTYQLSFLDLVTDDSTIRTLLIARGAAMGLITMPAMTVAMNTLPNHLIARGSSLTNVLRQVFAAFGTATFSTILTTRQTYHLVMLSQTMTPDVPSVQMALANVQQLVMQHGATLQQARLYGVLALYREVAAAASVRAFDNCFLIAGAFCLVGIIPALFLRGKGTVARAAGPRMSE
jgi:EmrB/QacA subfamily drug resistance transporter